MFAGPSVIRSTTSMTVFDREEHCPPIHSRNLTWEWTKAGTDVFQKCPGGTFGKYSFLISIENLFSFDNICSHVKFSRDDSVLFLCLK